MLALVVDTFAHPRAMCYKCYNKSISFTTRFALNEFQASCYSHNRSQSALSETNWLLRVLGCNLTLNPYLVIQMGHHHGHPLIGAMELRPDHWSTTLGIPPRESQGITHWHGPNFLNQPNRFSIHTHNYIHTSHTVSHDSSPSYSQPSHTNSLFSNPEYGTPSHIVTMPHWYQPFHVSCQVIPNSSFQFHTSSHTIFMLRSYQPIIHNS